MRKTLEIVLVSVTTLAVLAFGGTEPVSYAAVEIALFAALLAVVAARGPAPAELRPLPLLPLFLSGIVLFQLAPLPRGIALWLGRAAEPVSGSSFFPVSIAPSETLSHFLILLSYVAVFYLTLTVAGCPDARRRMVYALLALGSFEGLYGLMQYLTGWQQIFTYTRVHPMEAAAGTYINRNHFAGLLEMVLPFALALGVSHLRTAKRPHEPLARRIRALLYGPDLPRSFLWLALAAVLLLALFFSFSRMGILAGLCAMLWVFALTGTLWLPRRAGLILAMIFVCAGVGLVMWVGPGPVISRFGELDQEATLTGQSRLAIWRDTLQLIRQHPLLGTGLGTFPIAYPSVQTALLDKFVNRAHNDYLELASDLGVPAACVLFGSILTVLVRTTRRLRSIPRPFDRAIALGATGSILAILLHSFADFNLYVPANALIFCMILGLAVSLRAAHAPPEGAAA